MRRPSTGLVAALLAGASIFGGVVAAQASDNDNRDVPADRADDGADGENTRYASFEEARANRAFEKGSQVHLVPAAAFTADGARPDTQFFPFGGGYFEGTDGNYGCLVAPVMLPQGSRVTDLIGFLYDNDGGFNSSMRLRRADLGGGGVLNMATVATTGTSTDTQFVGDDTVSSNVIDNEGFAYFLTTCALSADLRVYGAALLYQEDLAIDPHSPIVVPVTPFRAYDSRFFDGPLGGGENRLVSVRRSIDIETGAVIKNNAIPAGATAIMFNLAVTNTIGGGFVAATPGDATEFSTASINWSATGQTVNNGTFVELDANRRIRAFVGGTPGAETDFIIDVTGYVIPDS